MAAIFKYSLQNLSPLLTCLKVEPLAKPKTSLKFFVNTTKPKTKVLADFGQKLETKVSTLSLITDNPFSEQEFKDVVFDLKLNKSPGLDGLTPEFYKAFWNYIKSPYIDMIAESFSQGILPESTRKSVVTLIYKKADRELLKTIDQFA